MKGCVKNKAYLLPRSAICVVISRFFSFCGLVIPSTLGKSSASSSSLESTENLASIIVIFRPRPWPREQHKFSLLNCHLITQKPEFRSWSERCGNADYEYCRIIIKLGLLRRTRRTTYSKMDHHQKFQKNSCLCVWRNDRASKKPMLW